MIGLLENILHRALIFCFCFFYFLRPRTKIPRMRASYYFQAAKDRFGLLRLIGTDQADRLTPNGNKARRTAAAAPRAKCVQEYNPFASDPDRTASFLFSDYTKNLPMVSLTFTLKRSI